MHGYYLPRVLLIVVSLWVSLAGFLWALKEGQFSEQERARYLPLRGELVAGARKEKVSGRRELIVLIGVLGIGGALMLCALIVLFLGPGGG